MTTGVGQTEKYLAFHKLLSVPSFGVTNYSPRRLENLLQLLRGRGDMFGSIDPSKIILTFDDGYRHLADILPPLLERSRFRAIIFMPVGLVGQPNRWDYTYFLRPTPHLGEPEIHRLAEQGVEFGCHGWSHTDLTRCPPDQLTKELEQARDTLCQLTGQEVTTLSYPFGRHDQRVREAADAAGYKCGFSMKFPTLDDQALATGRFPIYAYDTPLAVARKLSPGRWQTVERMKAGVASRLSGGTVLLNRLRRHDEGNQS